MNPWLEHVKQYRAAHPNLSYKECLKAAKSSYKSQKGEGLSDVFKAAKKTKDKALEKAGRAILKGIAGAVKSEARRRGAL